MRALKVLAILALPPALALAVAVAMGAVAPRPALLILVAIVAGTALMVVPVLRGLDDIVGFLQRLGDDDGAPPDLRWPGFGGALAAAAARLARGRQRQRAQLEASRDATETILHALADPMLLLDSGRNVVFANRAAEARLGGGLVGRNLAAVLRVPAVMSAADRVFAGQPAEEFVFELGGEPPRLYLGHLQILGAEPTRGSTSAHADGGKVALALHDVTELERTHRLRADFVANASHEIRTPLTTIVGAVETLLAPTPEADRQRFLLMIQEHAERIRSLVEDLLSLSRIERSEHRLPQDTVDLRTLLALARAALERKAEARGIALTLSIAEDLPAVTADADELQQVFENLIDNAIKYGAESSEVTIEARSLRDDDRTDGWRPPADGVVVSVSDHGPGIAPEHIPRLTERFYRVDAARSRQLGGTGLGLAIVKHIVNRHRGALIIDSTPGEGSRFTVALAAAPAREQPALS